MSSSWIPGDRLGDRCPLAFFFRGFFWVSRDMYWGRIFTPKRSGLIATFWLRLWLGLGLGLGSLFVGHD